MLLKKQKNIAIDYIKTEIELLEKIDNLDEIIKGKYYIEMALLLLVKLNILTWDQVHILSKELSITSQNTIDFLSRKHLVHL